MKWLAVSLFLLAYLFLSGPSMKAQEAPPTVQFASASYTVNENAGTAILTVTLSWSATGVVTVNYATSDGTAVVGTDYTAASGTLTFNPGVTSQTISIGIIDNDNYSNQSVYFTVALSQPSSNATLGTPSTTTVNVLDNDLAPVADIEIQGVPPDTPGKSPKNNPGGYVQVNANNDNGYGYPLTYSDGVTAVPPGASGIPQKRDLDLTLFESADPDLLEIDLQTQNLKPGGPEKIVLSVSVAGRAQVAIWEDNTKNISIQTPTNWTKVAMPASVYVEGLVEGDDLRQVTLTLQILNNGNVVSKDTCTLTVTPVLTNLEVKAAQGAAPNLALDQQLGLILDSGAGELGRRSRPMHWRSGTRFGVHCASFKTSRTSIIWEDGVRLSALRQPPRINGITAALTRAKHWSMEVKFHSTQQTRIRV
jgi:hypothetical protein